MVEKIVDEGFSDSLHKDIFGPVWTSNVTNELFKRRHKSWSKLVSYDKERNSIEILEQHCEADA